MITCWYKNISMANYGQSLQASSDSRVEWQTVTANCLCSVRYCGRKNIFQGDCKLVSFPPYLPALENGGAPRGLSFLAFIASLFVQSLRGIAYLSKCKDSDVIHYQLSSLFSFGIVPLYVILAIPSKKKRIVTVHNIILPKGMKFLIRAFKKPDRIIVHSNEMKKKMLLFKVPESKIKLVPHGTTLPPLSNRSRTEITFFGAPIKAKGFWTLIQAVKILKMQNHEMKVHVYGIYTEAEKNEAVNEAMNMDVADMLVWGGRLSEAEFNQKMQESIFTLVVYSWSVSGSSILTRAMGNAAPIIASNVGGIPEYLGDAGLLIPPDDPQALAVAMTKLLDDLPLRERLSEMSRKKAETFSWNNVAAMTINIYFDCLRESKA